MLNHSTFSNKNNLHQLIEQINYLKSIIKRENSNYKKPEIVIDLCPDNNSNQINLSDQENFSWHDQSNDSNRLNPNQCFLLRNKSKIQQYLSSQGRETCCERCTEPFTEDENIVSVKNGFYHPTCFVCAQCFRPLPDKEFYEFEGRRYCKYDFQMLFAPFCHKCGEFVMSKVVKALGRSWHPECLTCDECGTQLVSKGLQRFQNKILCRNCHNIITQQYVGCHQCHQCKHPIEPGQHMKYGGEFYHAHHFTCIECNQELGPDANERAGDLYCLQCFGRLGIPICAACRRPIDGRIVWALGKSWHVEHFVCYQCEIPFMGGRFYEYQGHAYCLLHYQSRVGNICHICYRPIIGITAKFTNKAYCPNHFQCSICDKKLDKKTKLYEIDLKPVCKDCYDKLPLNWKRILAKIHLQNNEKWYND